jgi:hypothetical protein
VAVVGLGVLVFAGSAQACSCAPVKPGAALRGADAAFAGKLVRVVPRNRQRAVFRYRVRRVFKAGPGLRRGRMVSVLSARSSAACGLPTRTGRRYRLALARLDGRWSAGLCSLLRGRCAS